MGDGLGFARTDKQTLKSTVAERVFLVGDNAGVPTSKAGSVAHFQAEAVVHNILREIDGKEAEPCADGHANCFIETGYGKAVLIDFNYDIQPVPGKFPMPILGPMTLLKETYVNHLGKLAFKHVYWNVLLPALISELNAVEQPIAPGVHALSNHLLDTPWPKVVRGKKLFGDIVSRDGSVTSESIFDVLADTYQPDDSLLPNTGVGLKWERILSPIFVQSPVYGTQFSTVIMVDKKNRVSFTERAFQSRSVQYTERTFEFILTNDKTT